MTSGINKALGYEYGSELARIFGIQYLTDAQLNFPMDGAVTATITFIVSTQQAEQIVKMLDSPPKTADEIKAALKKHLRAPIANSLTDFVSDSLKPTSGGK